MKCSKPAPSNLFPPNRKATLQQLFTSQPVPRWSVIGTDSESHLDALLPGRVVSCLAHVGIRLYQSARRASTPAVKKNALPNFHFRTPSPQAVVCTTREGLERGTSRRDHHRPEPVLFFVVLFGCFECLPRWTRHFDSVAYRYTTHILPGRLWRFLWVHNSRKSARSPKHESKVEDREQNNAQKVLRSKGSKQREKR